MIWWLAGGVVLALLVVIGFRMVGSDGGWDNRLPNYYVRPQDRV
jgi:hypothetical protein